MKTSFAAVFVLGVMYLYLLEDVGNFITRDLDNFENQVAADKAFFTSGQAWPSRELYRRALFRLALDDVIDIALSNDRTYVSPTSDLTLSDASEAAYLDDAIIMYEDLLMDKGANSDGYLARNDKLDYESVVYDNFYKRVFVDILSERTFPTTVSENIRASSSSPEEA